MHRSKGLLVTASTCPWLAVLHHLYVGTRLIGIPWVVMAGGKVNTVNYMVSLKFATHVTF